jgi:hypothetical protein
MSAHDDQRLLLACLVAILRRARGTLVIEEADIEHAYKSLDEITWKRDRPTRTLRLSVPPEDLA